MRHWLQEGKNLPVRIGIIAKTSIQQKVRKCLAFLVWRRRCSLGSNNEPFRSHFKYLTKFKFTLRFSLPWITWDFRLGNTSLPNNCNLLQFIYYIYKWSFLDTRAHPVLELFSYVRWTAQFVEEPGSWPSENDPTVCVVSLLAEHSTSKPHLLLLLKALKMSMLWNAAPPMAGSSPDLFIRDR